MIFDINWLLVYKVFFDYVLKCVSNRFNLIMFVFVRVFITKNWILSIKYLYKTDVKKYFEFFLNQTTKVSLNKISSSFQVGL